MKSDKPIKICIQRADKLGDVILSLPVVDKIAEEYPTAELHFLTSSIGENFLQYHPKVSKIHTCNVDEKWTSDAYKTLIHTLRAEEYDVFISLWNHPKMAVAARLSGAQIRVGDATGFLLKHCYTHPIRQQWEDLSRHQIGHNLDLLRPLNISSELTAGWIPIRKETQEAVQKELSKWTNSSKKTVLIFTGTGGTNEPIPEPAVADFIRLLSQQDSFQIVLAGQEREGSMFNTYTERGALNFVGRTTLEELAALIDVCDYYIGPDTGPTHIASFLQKPMLFFSSMKPNPPARWGSLSVYQQIIRQEYNCDHFGSLVCIPETCFKYVTGALLYQSFGELLIQQSLNDAKRGQSLKTYHMKHTFRALCPTTDLGTYDTLFKASSNLREDNILAFPYLISGWNLKTVWFLIRKAAQHNVSILHGPIPFWVRWCIQLYMGVIYAYIKPIYIHVPLLPEIPSEDLLELYTSEFQYVRSM